MTQIPPVPLPLGDFVPTGELASRLRRNFDRMEEHKYRPENVFLDEEASFEWAGDTEGRTVLALSLLTRATGRPARYLDEIVRLIPERTNDRGFFGPDRSPDCHEQQMFGHGWVLRGLAEEYRRTGDAALLDLIGGVVDGLLVPSLGAQARYPIDPAARRHGGDVMGHSADRLDGWILSSDIGANFAMIDGAVDAYSLRPSAELEAVIEEMIARYLQVDLVAIRAQTHSSLSAARGLLRWAVLTTDDALLREAESRYLLYRERSTTATWANYNWFERPRWSEPCAVVDAILLATQLWQHLGEPQYLADAQLMYFNALLPAQRSNGGFGCDTCAADDAPVLRIVILEAPFCCTMRGAEGLARVAEYAAFTSGADVVITTPHPGRYRSEAIDATIESRYPYLGEVDILIGRASTDARVLLFAPEWTSGHTVEIDGAPVSTDIEGSFLVIPGPFPGGTRISIRFDLATGPVRRSAPGAVTGGVVLRHGPLVLATEVPAAETRAADASGAEASLEADELEPADASRATYRSGPDSLAPLADLTPDLGPESSDDEVRSYGRRVLFRSR